MQLALGERATYFRISELIMDKICVIGLGYVGLPSAALIAKAGYEVVGVDVNKDLINELTQGKCRLEEPDVNELVEGVLKDGALTVSLSPVEADIFIVCVPTPVDQNGDADLSMVAAATKAAAPYMRKGNLVILESTSPINTTRDIIGGAIQYVGLDPHSDVDVCYCPERVFPGNTINEILYNDRIIGGLTLKAALRAQEFYASFVKGKPVLTTASTAEFSKLMENTYRDVNIALANVFARIAEETDVDVHDVIKLANMHPRVNVHNPGPGVGGHCIPVDPKFLISAFPKETSLLAISREVNDTQAIRMIDRAEAAGLKRGATVAILGAAYRGDIDDARDTPTEILIKTLGSRGYTWRTHDPLVNHFHMHNDYPSNLTKNLDEALNGVSAAFLMTAHSQYKGLTAKTLKAMDDDSIFFDGPAMLSAEEFENSSLKYMRIGKATK